MPGTSVRERRVRRVVRSAAPCRPAGRSGRRGRSSAVRAKSCRRRRSRDSSRGCRRCPGGTPARAGRSASSRARGCRCPATACRWSRSTVRQPKPYLTSCAGAHRAEEEFRSTLTIVCGRMLRLWLTEPNDCAGREAAARLQVDAADRASSTKPVL